MFPKTRHVYSVSPSDYSNLGKHGVSLESPFAGLSSDLRDPVQVVPIGEGWWSGGTMLTATFPFRISFTKVLASQHRSPGTPLRVQ